MNATRAWDSSAGNRRSATRTVSRWSRRLGLRFCRAGATPARGRRPGGGGAEAAGPGGAGAGGAGAAPGRCRAASRGAGLRVARISNAFGRVPSSWPARSGRSAQAVPAQAVPAQAAVLLPRPFLFGPFLFRQGPAVRAEHLARAGDLRRPAPAAQPAGRVVWGPGPAQRPQPGAVERACLPGRHGQPQPAARGREPCDRVQQPVHIRRGEIDQQALGDPRGRPRRVQARGPQRGRPVVAQVAGHHDALAPGHGALGGEYLVLGAEHVRGVHLEAAGARRPGQPERPGVKARAEQHYLTAALLAGLSQQVVQEYGAGHHPDPEGRPPAAPGATRRVPVLPRRRTPRPAGRRRAGPAGRSPAPGQPRRSARYGRHRPAKPSGRRGLRRADGPRRPL